MTNTTETDLLAFYDRRHPEYLGRVSHWAFLAATYRGGREWFASNIFRYHKEGDKEYENRIARAYRFNHTREVVELVQKYLFKAPVARSNTAPEEVKQFWKRATIAGQGIEQLMRSASTSNSIGGRCAIVIDNNYTPPEGATAVSVAEAKKQKLRIYGYVVGAEDVLDYAWDEDGDLGLLWIKLREYKRKDADPFNDDGEVAERVRLWTRDAWYLFEEEITIGKGKRKGERKVNLIDAGEHNLGKVPVVLSDHITVEDPYLVPGLIDDIAYLDRSVANYLSNLDAIIQDQTFSQLVIPAQSLLPGSDPYQQLLEASTKRVFVYDAGMGAAARPEYISPDPKQAGVILQAVNKIINEIYHTIGLAGERTKEDNSVGIDNSSGVAKAYDFERVNSLLLSKAQACEKVENAIAEIVMLWHGKTLEEPVVTYPTTFDVVGLNDELITAEALSKLAAPKETRRLQMRQLVTKLFPQLDDETRKKLEGDIEEWLEESDLPPPGAPGSQPARPTAAPSRQGQVTRTTT